MDAEPDPGKPGPREFIEILVLSIVIFAAVVVFCATANYLFPVRGF
jgi:hypothetical protein